MAMELDPENQQAWNNLEVQTLNLLDNELYQANIHKALDEGFSRIDISINHLRQLDPSLPDLVLNQPARSI